MKESVPDLLLPDLIDPLIQNTLFSGRIRHYSSIGSTNTAGVQAAHAGAPEGTSLFAEEQTAGHGRGGHSWHSAPSTGIYVSVILRPRLAPADVLALSLIAGLATAAAVEEVTGLCPDLRWPNDLMLPHRKHARQQQSFLQRKFVGILTEVSAEASMVRHAVVGIGINVNQPEFPDDLKDLATSLRIESGREWPRVEIAAALLRALDREYRELNETGRCEGLYRRFEEASSYARGLRVHVDEGAGYAGVTEGLDARGLLLVRADDGTLRTVLSGGVRAV
jgi:BirA family biotin operon repressor/biotin-[acetyl-CoA-carboxylase] ligase